MLVGHSMGGLVARHYLEVLDGWRDTRMLVTFGTPYRGSLNALDFLCNGFKKKIGPIGVDLTRLLRSLTSVYQLLPRYPVIDSGSGDLTRVAETADLPGVDPVRAEPLRCSSTSTSTRRSMPGLPTAMPSTRSSGSCSPPISRRDSTTDR